ncbi:permease [Anaeromonas frigoriresistens]|nr:permease [Anaeromonas frigoriresistens]
MRGLKFFKKNKFLIFIISIYLIITLFNINLASTSLNNSSYYIKEMLLVMPIIFIAITLIDVWVPKKVIIDRLGDNSGKKGILLSFILGSISAGPIYAAFPMASALLKKGASISNIVIIISSWAVIKIPLLANEIKFIGFKFMIVRWILTVISIMIMAKIISNNINIEEINPKEKII